MRLAGSQLIPQFQHASLSITRYTSPLSRCPTIRPPFLHPPFSYCERGQNAACAATKQTCVEHSDFTQDTKLLPLQCALTKRAGHLLGIEEAAVAHQQSRAGFKTSLRLCGTFSQDRACLSSFATARVTQWSSAARLPADFPYGGRVAGRVGDGEAAVWR